MALKIDFLSKEELIYELWFRGVDATNDEKVDNLRKRLRQVIGLKVSTNVSNLSNKLTGNEEFRQCVAAYEVMVSRVEKAISDNKNLEILRCQSKINHWVQRLSILGNLFKMSAEMKAKVEKITEGFQELDNMTREVNLDGELCEEIERQLSESNMELEGEENDAVKVVKPRSASCVGNEVGVPGTRALSFNKLPNPLERYFRMFSITDGLRVNDLLNFLKVVIKMKVETSCSDEEILQICVSFCQGPLLARILEMKNSGCNVDMVHKHLLTTFVPFSHREKLKFERVYRPQRYNEGFSGYVLDIKEWVSLLAISLSEQEVVELIKTGLNPETRNKMVFMGNPSTFKELDEICIKYQNVDYADYLRKGQQGVVNRAPRLNVNYVHLENKRTVICFKCRKPGHYANECNAQLPSGYKDSGKVKQDLPPRFANTPKNL
uniref:CCHC-type domain-containing protein n=1 Tax=Graphocephala atropunctata TaxID=36148 RepID=A0A1B6L3W2_9HEMI